jgi:hypothetical protein
MMAMDVLAGREVAGICAIRVRRNSWQFWYRHALLVDMALTGPRGLTPQKKCRMKMIITCRLWPGSAR